MRQIFNLFNHYKKIIIPCLGVVFFMLTGVLAMFVTSSGPQAKTQTQSQPQQVSQVQEVLASPQTLPEVPEIPESKPQTQEQTQTQHEDWFVYVTGAVNKPGVYKLPDNPRVFHAVESAGGMTAKADRNSLNLAEKILMDGLHIHIYEMGEREALEAKEAKRQAAKSMTAQNQTQTQQVTTVKVPGIQVSNVRTRTQTQTQNAGSNLVDVNHASEQELTRLKGVGPAIAKRIIDFRNNMGSFKSPEDLLQVRGIGPKTLEKMRPQILIR